MKFNFCTFLPKNIVAGFQCPLLTHKEMTMHTKNIDIYDIKVWH